MTLSVLVSELRSTVADDDSAIGSVADRCLLSGVKQKSNFKGVRTVFEQVAQGSKAGFTNTGELVGDCRNAHTTFSGTYRNLHFPAAFAWVPSLSRAMESAVGGAVTPQREPLP